MVDCKNVLEIIKVEKRSVFGNLYKQFRDLNPNILPNQKLGELLKSFCHSLELTINQIDSHTLESFKSVHKTLTKFKTQEEFCKVLISWTNLNKLEYIPIQSIKHKYNIYLKKLQNYYKKALILSPQEEKTVLSSSIFKINSKLSLFSKLYFYEPPTLTFRDDLLPSEKSILQEIFHFYSNSHITLSKSTTFDCLNLQKQLWTVGIFIKFCKTFQISARSKQKLSISLKTLVELFSKSAILKKSLDFSGFLKLLEDLACEFFNIPGNCEFDLDPKTSPHAFKIALMDHLKILNVSKIRKTLKNSVKSFGSADYQPRIAANDPCFSYKFTVSTTVHNKLKELKLEKELKKNRRIVSTTRNETAFMIRTRPVTSNQSVQSLRRSTDTVNVYIHSKSKGSLVDELLLESC